MVVVLVTELCPTLATSWTVACHVPLSIGFFRKEWSGLPFPSPGDLPYSGIELVSPALEVDSLPTELCRKLLYIIQNARLDEIQAGIKIARRSINHLRYTDDTTLMAESKEELKSLLMKVKEEGEKADLKLNILKMKIMASSPITSW